MLCRTAAKMGTNAVVVQMPCLRGDQVVYGLSKHLLAGITRQRFCGAVDRQYLALQVLQENNVICVFKQLAKPLFAATQSLFRSWALNNAPDKCQAGIDSAYPNGKR